MRGTLQDIVHALLGAVVTGGAVLPAGASGKQIAVAAVTGAAVAVWHLYTDKKE